MRILAAVGRAVTRVLLALRLLVRVAAETPRARRDREAARRDAPEELDLRERRIVATRRREGLVAALLGAASLCSLAFVVLVLTGDPVQLEGLTLGGALAFLAAALCIAGSGLVPQVTAVEPRPRLEQPEEHEPLLEEFRRGGEGVSRRGLLTVAGLGAGATLGAAFVAPVASLGPAVGDAPSITPWRRGRALVDETGEPVLADTLVEGAFLTAFPEGADRRELGSPVVVVRVDPATLQLPPARRTWAPEGLLAFSKICTHAGCAITLYRSPLYEPSAEREPALQCPCHYSTFAVRRGAEVTLGPAPRPLPQLPLFIDALGVLRAGGGLSGPVGPSWWGVRLQ